MAADRPAQRSPSRQVRHPGHLVTRMAARTLPHPLRARAERRASRDSAERGVVRERLRSIDLYLGVQPARGHGQLAARLGRLPTAAYCALTRV
jgi:hypothetical protein